MGLNSAIFAGGCFWGVEHFFKGMIGVSSVISGYSGGHTENPSYEDVITGTTGHIEVVQIEYDANIVSYDALLDMFFKIHDPTTIDRQGPDIGEQYKSVIFYANQDEMNAANKKIKIFDVLILRSNQSNKHLILVAHQTKIRQKGISVFPNKTVFG